MLKFAPATWAGKQNGSPPLAFHGIFESPDINIFLKSLRIVPSFKLKLRAASLAINLSTHPRRGTLSKDFHLPITTEISGSARWVET
jgi:hypothetical protein